jgi:hypothetical protein
MTRALILGAGASYGTFESIPTAAKFGAEFRRLQAQHGWPDSYDEDVLNAVRHLGFSRADWPLEDVLRPAVRVRVALPHRDRRALRRNNNSRRRLSPKQRRPRIRTPPSCASWPSNGEWPGAQ